MRYTATFRVTGWDSAPYDEPEDGPHLSRVAVRKTFQGDLEGEAVGEALLCQTDPASLAAGGGYVVSDRVSGRLGGREGTFVLQHGGLGGAGTVPWTYGHVVPGSGTGALRGLRGTAEIAVEDGVHTLTLDVDLDEPTA